MTAEPTTTEAGDNDDEGQGVALVCGASRGIGYATAVALAMDGYRVIALARSQEKLDGLMETLAEEELGDEHLPLAVDLLDREALLEALDAVLDEVGPVHCLVNNLAGPKAGALLDADPGDFAAAVDAHVGTAQLLAQRLVPGMAEMGFGRIINVISTSVRAPIPNLGVSNAARGAMAAWAKTLSAEVAPAGITVNNVLPGYTATERLDELIAAAAARLDASPEEVAEDWRARVPMGRFAEPAEIAALVSFLASPSAGYLTGESIRVDGGRTGSI